MKLSKLHFLGIFLLIVVTGCSTSVTPPPAPQVNYVQNQKYIYYAQELNATTGDTVAGSGDTITSVVLATGISYQGMNGVTEIQNTHTHPISSNPMDTTYIAQSNGNFWHYNYGIEILNSSSAVLNDVNNGNQIKAGWVLQAQLSDGPGTTWAAADTTLSLAVGSVILTDTATEATDTSITVAGAAVFAKHSAHNVVLNAGLIKATLKADTYVSSTDGPVLDIDHPTTLELTPTPGRITILLSAP
jgi:hypothetical protein